MFVTNLTNAKLGLSGTIVLRARETNRYIDDKNKALVESALRAKAANLVSVVREEGLVKTVTTNAVKTLTVDAGGIGTEPRTSAEKVESFSKKLEAKEASVKKEVANVVDTSVEATETKKKASKKKA